MSILHDAYIALLSGLTYRTGNEIHWQGEGNYPFTIEPIDIENERYILREYYSNGKKHYEIEYKNDQIHGKSIWWYDNGQKRWEEEYGNGMRHGKSLSWFESGQKYIEEEYQNDQLHGKYIKWYDNGQKNEEAEFQNDLLHGKSIGWYSDGEKHYEIEFYYGEVIRKTYEYIT